MKYRLLNLKTRILQGLIWCAGWVLLRKHSTPSDHYRAVIQSSGIFSSSNLRNDYDAIKLWSYSSSLWVKGQYLKSIDVQRNVLTELYRRNQVLYNGYFPPGISNEYVGPIGHQALLCIHVAAQQLGIIEPRSAILPISKEQLKKPIINSMKNHMQFLQYTEGASWDRIPNQWHNFERLQLVRTFDDFIGIYQLVESVFQASKVNRFNPLIELPQNYEDAARSQLQNLGLPNDAWFATIHVRNSGGSPSRRNQPVETYFAAVNEIIAAGGWVVRVGDKSMAKFPISDRFIDLAVSNQDYSYLHPYALAQAKFFIGTSSGPASIPPLFGVPTLVTNATSIGRNALSSSEHSIYIPKKTIDSKGRLLTYSEVLNSVDGFGELELSELREFNLSLECNSEEDILLATRELMSKVEGNYKTDNQSLLILNQIRDAFPYASRGNFAQTFLDRNSNWLN